MWIVMRHLLGAGAQGPARWAGAGGRSLTLGTLRVKQWDEHIQNPVLVAQ